MKTLHRELKDGAHEIVRLLSPAELENWSKDDPLSYEKSIVWLCDVRSLPYVRVKQVPSALSRRGPIYLGGDARVVGYSKLTPNAPRNTRSKGYTRRVFYLRAVDLQDVAGAMPRNAVDPKTVFPGVNGT
ncbi:MAG: DUF6009 family protein [Pirellulaceae bacterium]|jgi:hypothetical protein|nr:DUF6009 family protein [Pirellulaceae bacterium]